MEYLARWQLNRLEKMIRLKKIQNQRLSCSININNKGFTKKNKSKNQLHSISTTGDFY